MTTRIEVVEPREILVRVAMLHPFMAQFQTLDSEGFSAILKVAAAMALAEVAASELGDHHPSRARTVLIVCMKQHHHLDNLAKLMSKLDLKGVPTLIVDDEGDQAGINTKAKKNEQSTTYARILALRDRFPEHSYILYTATPQAPLLISRIDTLSPDFGMVLTPGEQYVGGQDFFSPAGQEKYVETILASEVPDPLNPPVS